MQRDADQPDARRSESLPEVPGVPAQRLVFEISLIVQAQPVVCGRGAKSLCGLKTTRRIKLEPIDLEALGQDAQRLIAEAVEEAREKIAEVVRQGGL